MGEVWHFENFSILGVENKLKSVEKFGYWPPLQLKEEMTMELKYFVQLDPLMTVSKNAGWKILR